ncbi:DEAD/DEAH box helicase [Streptomyces sp. AV19]|uniref:DEAD/DEAH box helicase n=1 Tax=Streptomyces sp. AV19 TaxID=2793068 RepID=UPI0024133FD9|nr:DEAD/DEAH box helicase [Streptomyces sp. AV19]MDG4536044.1 DEAD/DEAH box helicase [Streptomyces sp. AV19]
MTLPVALSGSDVIGQAKTGTGKTLGFGLPLLERVIVPADVEAGRAKPEQLTDAPQALIVVPTRELCQQVTNDLLTAGKVRNVRVQAIYGGRAYEPQVEALKNGCDVVVGTPGRLLDLAGQKKLDLSHVKALVLDEADEMLDLGFLPDVERIITMLPAKRQTMLFSATMPGAVISLARRYMDRPTHIRATSPNDEGQTHANIAQHVFRAHSMDKPEMVARILQAEGRDRAMIFCRTKRTAADIADQLLRRGFASGAVHGDLGQGAREQALRAFRNGKIDVLVCTDVAARGIDVDNVTHVVNYQSPEDEKTYLHRIGRTGRAGKSGTAVTLVDWDDVPRWKLINKALELGFDEPEETYSTSSHLFEALGIPAGTKGILPRSERTKAGLAAEEIEDLGETGGRGAGRGRGPKAAPAPVADERPERTRTPRQRRRTRGGASLDAAATPAPTPVADETPAASATAVETTAPETPARPRRRRRTRSTADASSVTPSAPVATEAPAPAPAEAEAPVEKAPSRRARPAAPASVPVQAPPARRAPVRRVAAPVEPAAEVGFETVEAAILRQAAAAAAAAAVEPKRRSTVKKATAEAVEAPEAVEAVETAKAPEATEEKPKRRRVVRKATVEAPEAEAAVEEKPKRTRTVKKATEAAEAVEPEEKPKRTRATKKAAATVEGEPEAKPKRTRTTKKAVAAAEPTEEAEAKPKRTRTAKKAAPTAAPEAAEAPETTEEKPKRRRVVRKTATPAAAEATA